MNMYSRTGHVGFAFVTRSHIEDSTAPHFIGDPTISGFLRDYLGKDYWDILSHLENWRVTYQGGTCWIMLLISHTNT